MKLNYTSLQHAVEPVEAAELELPVEKPVAVCFLHAQLPCVAWAAREPRAGSATCRRGAVRCPGRIRAWSPSCSSAGCSPATSPPARLRRPARRDHHDRRAARRADGARLGRRDRRARARESSARRPRSATAAWPRSTRRTRRSRSAAGRSSCRGCRRAIARARHSGRVAPHAHGARPGAQAGRGRDARRRGPGGLSRQRAAGHARWAARPRRTRRSSGPRSPAGGCWRRRSGRNPAVAFERIASDVVYERQDRDRLRGHCPLRRRRRGGRARVRRPSRRRRDGRPRRRARLPRAPAARAGRRAGGARAARRQARRGGRGPARDARSASWPRRSASRRASGSS